ncbi:MAG: hypothetical protein HGB12_01250 [Bacteroidetes bacterium]|nr:hypothetical protein [Bacteroidota bacterium]
METNKIYIKELDEKIIRFIKEHHIFTLATSNNNKPYCCTCFYYYNEKENNFLFTSDLETRHIEEAVLQPIVAGAIALETTMIGKIRGIQFTGKITKVSEEYFKIAKSLYVKRFPIASLSKLLLWKLEPDFIKFTDNRLGFGKKMIWQKEE